MVEGSICEAYIVEKISNFVSLYFDVYLQMRHTQVPRNDDSGEVSNYNCLSIFRHPCRLFRGWCKYYLTDNNLHIIHTYVLFNNVELEPYIE
ncbi:hypothetical protein CDL12_21924 [Handroanthus impetiginosus]|uniref:Uncharacterized protein n=1 Tax=Handroanthus impetiginosus TaxID=429701 RepID=A0A2G9GJQ7_9LAMI|nr:hypothetical protein CDL12_21924 [Handroanthus impetiginosus]